MKESFDGVEEGKVRLLHQKNELNKPLSLNLKSVDFEFMTTANIIRELDRLPLTDKLFVIERALKIY